MLLLSHQGVSNSLWSHGLQNARLPCPSPSPGICSNSCPLSRRSIQTSHPRSFPFPPVLSLSQHQGLFQWVGSSSLSPSNKYLGLISFRIDWFGLVALVWIQNASQSPNYIQFTLSITFQRKRKKEKPRGFILFNTEASTFHSLSYYIHKFNKSLGPCEVTMTSNLRYRNRLAVVKVSCLRSPWTWSSSFKPVLNKNTKASSCIKILNAQT